MTARITIDPNVRVRGNGTFSGFEHVEGLAALGEVEVYESETGAIGRGWVTEIDSPRRLVYLEVDWASLCIPARPLFDLPPFQVGTVAVQTEAGQATGEAA